jgi:predicted acetyltransferase
VAIEVRPVREDELAAWIDVVSTGFLERPDVGPIVEMGRELWDLTRTWAAFDDGRLCGTFRSWATELTVPGPRVVPAAAVAAVAVLPTHRRRGILRALARAEHAAARERGEAVAILWAAEYPIYGRLGYGPATRSATWTIDALATAFHGAPSGAVELVPATPETRDALRDVFDAVRVRRPGGVGRRGYHWDIDLGLRASVWDRTWKGFVALHRDDSGRVDGYARYHVEEKWERRQPRHLLAVDDLQALTDAVEADLWRFLCSVDLVATVRAPGRSPSDRLPWLLTNARAAEPSEVGDGIWVRLLDVRRALEARTYEREGSIVLEVVDGEADGGRTRLALEANPFDARVTATDRSADLTLDAAALGAAYLGGTRLRDAVVASGVEEHRPGALDEADALLRTTDEPWCATFF